MEIFDESQREKIHAERQLALQIDSRKLTGLKESLGPNGPGAFYIPGVLDEEQLAYVNEEVFDPFAIAWRDNHTVYRNKRREVTQNHTVYALKLSRGDQRHVWRVPRLRALAAEIESFVTSLDEAFPSLRSFMADEMSLHRYDDAKIGLSFHKDNARFFGLVAVLTLEGQSEFVLEGVADPVTVVAGGLMLTRVNGLYPHPVRDAANEEVNICPDHGVYNMTTPYRTAFIVRANTRPNEPIPGFTYDNWGSASS